MPYYPDEMSIEEIAKYYTVTETQYGFWWYDGFYHNIRWKPELNWEEYSSKERRGSSNDKNILGV
jgi:hypothetical protein